MSQLLQSNLHEGQRGRTFLGPTTFEQSRLIYLRDNRITNIVSMEFSPFCEPSKNDWLLIFFSLDSSQVIASTIVSREITRVEKPPPSTFFSSFAKILPHRTLQEELEYLSAVQSQFLHPIYLIDSALSAGKLSLP